MNAFKSDVKEILNTFKDGASVTFGTGHRPSPDQHWGMDDTPLGMILVDILDDDGDFHRSFLERTGHSVVVCHGPAHATLCPLLAGTGCDKVDAAHGIMFVLDLDRAQHRAILHRYREVTRPDVPIRAVVRPGQRERFADTLAGIEIWEHEPTVADLDGFAAEVEAVDRGR